MIPDTATLLYRRVEALADLDSDAVEVRNRSLHAALAQVCHEGVKDTGMAFGNLFSQVGYLCRSRAVAGADRQEVRTRRRHSNSAEPIADADWPYDLRALALLVSAVTSTDVPSTLVGHLPVMGRPADLSHTIDRRYLRGVVTD